ncbi:MAG: hypothetical protein JSS02_21815 [Planctomycetes bacterium]|nr:hypothetical protein [Planctomycetota bacterium]
MSNQTPEPRKLLMRVPRPLWIGLVLVALIVTAVRIFHNSPNARLPLPDINDVQSMEADFYDSDKQALVTFQVPAAHWQPIFSSLLPARRDSNPAKWESLGDLRIKLARGGSLHVSLYSVSDGLGAFSAGPSFETGIYYRGGNSRDLEQTLADALKASNNNQ